MCNTNPSDIGQVVSDSDQKSARGSVGDLLADLVTANHILFERGVLDAFGHVSVRHPDHPDRFFLSRNKAPGLVTIEDIIEYDQDSNPIDAAGRSVYLERFIHGEIFRARPDVAAVVHSHSPSVVPFSIVKDTPFRAVCHMAAFIGTRPPVFEIRDSVGDASDLLVTNPDLGKDLAVSLAQHDVVLMRGHGSTVVGDTLKQAVFRAVYTEVNARTQALASSLGDIISLSEGETQTAKVSTEGQAARAWGLWERSAAILHQTLVNAHI